MKLAYALAGLLMPTWALGADCEATAQAILSADYRTLQVEVEGYPYAPPVLDISGQDRLVVSFDGLGEEREYLRYSIVHCDANWYPSPLADSEVFDGFNLADVEAYEYSRGTSVHYVHYTIVLPNEEFRFRLSGNYLLRVYREQTPEETLLQARFMVSENAVTVRSRALGNTDVDYRAEHQQIEAAVEADRASVGDLFSDITLRVVPNQRWQQAATLPHPSRVQGTQGVYEHMRDLIFEAGNEYRRMETVSVTYPGMGVEEIFYQEPYYHHVLKVDAARSGLPYCYDQTQRGRFKIREYNSEASDTEADYTVVHFAYDPSGAPLPPGAELHLEGELTNRRLDSGSRLLYDPETGLFQKALLLKQGAYNYQYVVVGADGKVISAPTEGNHYETGNEYLLLAYYRPPAARYDRLVGYTLVYAGQ